MANRSSTDPKLGLEIQNYLEKMGVATPVVAPKIINFDKDKSSQQVEEITRHLEKVMDVLGLDRTDDSLKETPLRIAKMFVKETYWGLNPENFPKCTTVENKMGYDEMVLEKNIKIMSECEHHFRPIHGVAHIAYIPKNKVLGLSKLNRIADYFARRPQIQERLTEQIYHALAYVLETPDVAVVIDAEHFCVKQRGIEDLNSSTVTSKLGGVFKSDPHTRAEFMALIKG